MLAKETEAAILGQIMASVDSAGIKHKLFEIIKDNHQHFLHPYYRELYKIMYELYCQGVKIDYPTMQEAVFKTGKRKELTAALIDAVQKARYAKDEYLAYALIDHSVRRQAKQLLERLVAQMDDARVGTIDAIQDAVAVLDRMVESNTPQRDDNFSSAVEAKLSELMDVIYERKPAIKYKSGYSDIDTLLGGFRPTDLSVIAARPSIGKTAFAVNIMLNLAMDSIPTYFFSLEMGKMEIVSRMMSIWTGIDNRKIRDYRLNNEEVKVVTEAAADLKRLPFHLSDASSSTLADIRMSCKRAKRSDGLCIAFIDYLQLMQPPKAYSREREVGIISSGLKAIAKDLDIHIVALSQLNRGLEVRDDKEPKLADLRDSGSIEQDADNVIFLHRPEVYKIERFEDQSPTKNICEVIIAKQRNGPLGRAKLTMKKEMFSFHNYISDLVVNSAGNLSDLTKGEWEDDSR